MKIAVLSDMHLGYGWGSERGEDAMRQAEEALDMAVAEKPDVIVLAGDIFDTRIPRPEVWAEALRILQKPLLAEKPHVRLLRVLNRPARISPIALSGIPVVAIHGTHERRGTHAINPIQTLEQAGFLIHLHNSGIVFDIGGQKLCVQGLSGVPEAYVRKILETWNPKPEPDCFNLFVFHQSLSEYIYVEGETLLSAADLPKGFDAYVDGHIHWSNALDGKIFFPGSTVITQQRRIESENRKGFFVFEAGKKFEYRFVQLPNQRPFYYAKLEFKDAAVSDVVKAGRAEIEKILSKQHRMKPMVALKLCGTLQKGKDSGNVQESDIASGFDAVVSVSNELESEEFLQKIGHLRELQQRKMSVEDMGLELIERMLRETKYSGPAVRDIIGQLADGETDAVLKRIMDDFKPDGKRGEGKEEKADVTLTSHPEQKKATEAIKPGRKTGGLADWA